jgi:uncharacterized cupredoxin-like copper-binding protein
MALRTPLLLAGCLLALSVNAMADEAHTYAFGHPAPADKATRTVEVTLQDISFSPKALDVKAGETVRFVLVNKGQLLHEFNLGDAQDASQRHAHGHRHVQDGPRRHGAWRYGRHEA